MNVMEWTRLKLMPFSYKITQTFSFLNHTPKKEGDNLKQHIFNSNDSEPAPDAPRNHDHTAVQTRN